MGWDNSVSLLAPSNNTTYKSDSGAQVLIWWDVPTEAIGVHILLVKPSFNDPQQVVLDHVYVNGLTYINHYLDSGSYQIKARAFRYANFGSEYGNVEFTEAFTPFSEERTINIHP